MAKPKSSESTDTPEVLQSFSVIIDGQDRTILAKDLDDLKQKVAKIRSQQ